MQEVIGFDFDGLIIADKGGIDAHYQWFEVMALLLKDPKIKALAGKEDYFKDVFAVMQRYFNITEMNDEIKKSMNAFARVLYSMIYTQKVLTGRGHLNKDLLEYIKSQRKEGKKIALISSAPDMGLHLILNALGIRGYFDYVFASSIDEIPNKENVMRKAIKFLKTKNAKLHIYVTHDDKDVEICKKMHISHLKRSTHHIK